MPFVYLYQHVQEKVFVLQDNLHSERFKKGIVYLNQGYETHEEDKNEASQVDSERPQATRFKRELLNLLREIRNCSSSILAYQEEELNTTDWSSLAVALDRLFLAGYLLFTIVVSLTIMLTASSGD